MIQMMLWDLQADGNFEYLILRSCHLSDFPLSFSDISYFHIPDPQEKNNIHSSLTILHVLVECREGHILWKTHSTMLIQKDSQVFVLTRCAKDRQSAG
jgi:hypothetical protein